MPAGATDFGSCGTRGRRTTAPLLHALTMPSPFPPPSHGKFEQIQPCCPDVDPEYCPTETSATGC